MIMVTRLPLGQTLLSPMKIFFASAIGRSPVVLALFTITSTSSSATTGGRKTDTHAASDRTNSTHNRILCVIGVISSESERELRFQTVAARHTAHTQTVILQFPGGVVVE